MTISDMIELTMSSVAFWASNSKLTEALETGLKDEGLLEGRRMVRLDADIVYIVVPQNDTHLKDLKSFLKLHPRAQIINVGLYEVLTRDRRDKIDATVLSLGRIVRKHMYILR